MKKMITVLSVVIFLVGCQKNESSENTTDYLETSVSASSEDEPEMSTTESKSEEDRLVEEYGDGEYIILSDEDLSNIEKWKNTYQAHENSDFENKDYDYKYDDPNAVWYTQMQFGINPVESPNSIFTNEKDAKFSKRDFKAYFDIVSNYPAQNFSLDSFSDLTAIESLYIENIRIYNKAMNIVNQYSKVPSGLRFRNDNTASWAESSIAISIRDKGFWDKLAANQSPIFCPIGEDDGQHTVLKDIDQAAYDTDSWSKGNDKVRVSGRVVFAIETYTSVEGNVLKRTTDYYDFLKNDYSSNYYNTETHSNLTKGISYGGKEFLVFEGETKGGISIGSEEAIADNVEAWDMDFERSK